MPTTRATAGTEAVELAASAGLILDPWEADVLDGALRERSDGTWAAFEVGLIVARQNGKGSILEARELAGLFLFGEELILHSAHEFKTAAEGFRRILSLIDGCADLSKRVARVRTSHGEEAIELITGQRLRFVARSTGSGRGFSGDCVILDEAYNLPSAAIAALLPTMAARPNPQLWYPSSAPLPRVESDTLRRLCTRGRAAAARKAKAPRLAYFEWSAPDDADHDDHKAWAAANPALGIRISEEFVASERAALDDDDFARERLGIYPDITEVFEPALDLEAWKARWDPGSTAEDPLTFAFEVSPDRKWSNIAASGRSPRGGRHVELVDNRTGTGWVVPRLIELRDRHHPAAIVCNATGPAGGLLSECERFGLEITTATAADYAQACQAAYDDVTEGRWRHLDQTALNTAVTNASKRQTGDSWVFDRRAGIDISPLVAVSLAAWAGTKPEVAEESMELVSW